MRRAMSAKAPSKASSVSSRSGSGTDQWIPPRPGISSWALSQTVTTKSHRAPPLPAVRGGMSGQVHAVAAGDLDGPAGDAVCGVRSGRGRGDFAGLAPERGGQLGPRTVAGADEQDAAGSMFAAGSQPVQRACSEPDIAAALVRLGAVAGRQAGGLQRAEMVGQQVGRHARVRPAAPWGKGHPGSAGP